MDFNSDTKYKTLHKGQVIFKEDQKSSVAYMLKTGRISLYRILNNKKVVLAEVTPGQIFGEEGLLGGGTRIANAVAEEPCEIIVMDRDTFQAMLLKSPAPIQRLARFLIEQVRAVNRRVAESSTGNVFLSVCGILEMMYKAHIHSPKSGGKAGQTSGLSYAEFSRTAKDILLVTQLEIDEVVTRLRKLKIIDVNDVRKAVMKKDALGRSRKTSDFLKDRTLTIPDLAKFMSVARNLSQEMPADKAPFTQCLEFIDIYEFAELVESKPETIYKKMSYKEIPETYFFMHKPTVEAWVGEVGTEFFQRVKKKRVKLEDLETVNDIVYVDNAALQDCFSSLGFHKVAILASMAGDEARSRIFSNLSKKMSKIVQEQAMSIENLDEMEAADAEDELIETIKRIKGLIK
ncbi:cyclic nucleotide-binding domain-containing protein [Desulfovibrio ferrophilus]|uniref:Cyclic nucleotide-binding domain-containing protein n=1 Tax=Desulfovibrio ferrophilus TaxID=241368 RepID=A0A2Z6AZT2_9BACT|nr:cyclic nucleotide-binding domain-containing protein [Desulfovibrio ferrophilus]BBD08703.1 uncharacterized protein DFE_1977 [Desulfovibrio ferrophilus]